MGKNNAFFKSSKNKTKYRNNIMDKYHAKSIMDKEIDKDIDIDIDIEEPEIQAKEPFDFLRAFYENIEILLPPYIREMAREEKLVFKIIEDGSPNAYMKKSGDVYIIAMTRNMDDLLYWSARIFSFYPEKMDMEEITSRFLDCLWMLREIGALKPHNINDINGQKYNPYTSAGTVTFFLAHEIGHIIVEHEHKDITDIKQIEKLADEYAVKIMVGYYNNNAQKIPTLEIYKAMLLGFYTFYSKDVLESNDTIDHPLIEERIENINNMFYEFYPKYAHMIKETAVPIETFYKTISKMVMDDSYHQRQIKIIEAKNVRIKAVHNIIDSATQNGHMPDYMTMYDKTQSIYNSMEYFMMIPELVELNREMISIMKELEELGEKISNLEAEAEAEAEAEKEEIIKSSQKKFLKAKLIIGYLDHLGEDLNILIERRMKN